jgi:uncharacterized protein YjbI with pentapeptide repeats
VGIYDPEHLKRLKQTKKCVVCDLRDANLLETHLKGAESEVAQAAESRSEVGNLEGAYLRGAILDGANLKGANTELARMRGAILCNTTGPDGGLIFAGCYHPAFLKPRRWYTDLYHR